MVLKLVGNLCMLLLQPVYQFPLNLKCILMQDACLLHLNLLIFHFHALEKEMATHSSVLAWRIPGTVEPGGLPSMGSHRVGHD